MYDEEGRKINLGQQVGMSLKEMSIPELKSYIGSLKSEITRVESEIETKKASTAAADAFFK